MEEKLSKIKLPSSTKLVSPDSLWKHLITIARTGNTFTSKQLLDFGSTQKVKTRSQETFLI
jgi:hypothetical protein